MNCTRPTVAEQCQSGGMFRLPFLGRAMTRCEGGQNVRSWGTASERREQGIQIEVVPEDYLALREFGDDHDHSPPVERSKFDGVIDLPGQGAREATVASVKRDAGAETDTVDTQKNTHDRNTRACGEALA